MRAAFFDVDGTLTTIRVWKGIMAYFELHRMRRGIHLLFLAVHYPLYFLNRLGVISQGLFRAPWAAHLAWYVRGFDEEKADNVWRWVAEEFLTPYWRRDTIEIIRKHQKQGDIVMLVSAGPQQQLFHIAKVLQVEHAVGTELEVVNSIYTGRSKEVCIDEKKAEMARLYLKRKGIDIAFEESYAYADASSDLHLLEMVGNPVATYPGPKLQEIAYARSWKIFPP